MSNYNIVQSFLTSNPRYTKQTSKAKTGYMQHSTGTPNAKAQNFIKAWNSNKATAETEFVIDDTGIYQLFPLGVRTWHCGGSGNNTHVGCEVCEPQEARLLDANWLELSRKGKNNTVWAVKRLQEELVAWGYDPNGIDGSFGEGCETAVKKFQAEANIKVDGRVGLQTLHALQTRDGSLLKYDPNNTQEYFEDVYNKAVWTCAYVIKELNSSVDEDKVLSHSEGFKKGIASNHADVEHWWVKHGKTMSNFRTDVKAFMTSGKLPYGEESQEKVIEYEGKIKIKFIGDKCKSIEFMVEGE